MFFMGRRKDGLWLKLKLVGKVIFFFLGKHYIHEIFYKLMMW